MSYYFPFGKEVIPLVQQDRRPKKVFVLGVYASAVHARWKKDGKVLCQALAVASEPRIFWDGDPAEAKAFIDSVPIPPELGTLEPAGQNLNGPSAKVLEQNILAPLAHPRQIGALGAHSEKWHRLHREWEMLLSHHRPL